ncbi:MAG: sigma-70 family RNA polymerase sigma factor [Bacillota bacterium]|nr:sigma-70 family RNA polymerase sigma factor [Bacillota bacterium]
MDITEQTLEGLFHDYSTLIYRFLVLMVNSREEAEDLTQEVFIRAYKGLPNFKGESSYKTWLYTIARNIAYDHCRKKKTLHFFKGLAHLEKNEPVPEEILAKKEQTQYLYKALVELKLSYREIIILRKIKGYQINETAEILGWSEAKVKTTLHRALNALKNELLKKGLNSDDQANIF